VQTVRQLGARLIGIADNPADEDDLRLRKRVGVAAGYLSILAPMSLPFESQWHPASWPVTASLVVFSATNLGVLARTGNFERYVLALIGFGTVFVPTANALGGGITGSTAGLVWAFLVPAYAILALGPRQATPWFAVFAVSLVLMALTDPWARDTFGPKPYANVVIGWTINVALPLTIVFLLLRFSDLRRRAAEARVDELLTNAIPASIVRRLRHGEQRIAEAYPLTTVLFGDIAGFTPWANRTDPSHVVDLLDDLFTRFDAAAAECGLEKIKTMGDAYMAVAGAPRPNQRHAEAALSMADRMLDAIAGWRDDHAVQLEIRIGLASGPVAGGIIGRQRILFDLWGDTVNTASRMESFGMPGRIQIAGSTRELLADADRFEPRILNVKGLGEFTAYISRR
jgi:guanylate cyclase